MKRITIDWNNFQCCDFKALLNLSANSWREPIEVLVAFLSLRETTPFNEPGSDDLEASVVLTQSFPIHVLMLPASIGNASQVLKSIKFVLLEMRIQCMNLLLEGVEIVGRSTGGQARNLLPGFVVFIGILNSPSNPLFVSELAMPSQLFDTVEEVFEA